MFSADSPLNCPKTPCTVATARNQPAVMDRLPDLPRVLGYQSRVGPVEWIGPSTDQVIRDLARAGVEDVLVIPISFVSDHVETLYEIDLLYGDQARALGIRNFRRARSRWICGCERRRSWKRASGRWSSRPASVTLAASSGCNDWRRND